MSRFAIRTRLAMLCAAVVAIAIVLACLVGWLVTRHTLRAQVDDALTLRATPRAVAITPPDGEGPTQQLVPEGLTPADLTRRLCRSVQVRPPPDSADQPTAQVQLILADGSVCRPGPSPTALTPSAAEREVAESGDGEVRRDAETPSGEEIRVLTRPLGDGVAIQSIRSLEEVDAALRRLALVLAAAALCGMLLAAAAGSLVARVVLRPVGRLTSAAEHVAATDDLDLPLDLPSARTTTRDEVARLTGAFNAMMTRLAGSRRRQQELVADASHELRTPVTSLRTNVEWLMRADDRERPMSAAERRRVQQAVLGQVDELADLVGDLARIARGDDRATHTPLALDEVVLRGVDRAQRRHPGRTFEVDVTPTAVTGDEAALERAVLNLLDNAVKFSDGLVTVQLHDSTVTVADRGDGLSETDRASAFERFWRAEQSRSLPGSGLGLAIVADVASGHGGEVFFGSRLGGGSEVGFTLPVTRDE